MSVKEIYDFGNKISLNPMNKFSFSTSQSKNIDFIRQSIYCKLYLPKSPLLAVRKDVQVKSLSYSVNKLGNCPFFWLCYAISFRKLELQLQI